ncbi:MAG: hypothetical protein HC837_10120 [Chloroflexaceae bacterium]|nr:hypothetical protein [Chloroflexaceae bacterium]
MELTTEPITYEELFSAWPTPGWFANGTNSLYLYVDSWNPGVVGGAIEESNENNNRSEITGLTVTGENPPFALLSQLNQWPQRGRTP